MPDFLLLIIVLCLLTTGVAAVVFFLADYDKTKVGALQVGTVAVILAGACGLALHTGGKYWAGQGDAPAFAKEWTQKWHPDGADVDCQPMDNDDNDYVTCTVGYHDKTGETQIEAIECGVNRWFQGWKVTGCRLMKGYSGSQR